MEIKKNKKNIFDYFTDGPSLFFVKFLHEHKSIIYDMVIEKRKTNKIRKFIRQLKKLVEYDFNEKEYENNIPKEYITNIVYEILNFQYKDIDKIDIFEILEKNLEEKYLYENFEIWWYQSIYMIGGSGYIRNINDYLKKYFKTDNYFNEKDAKEVLKKSFNRYSIYRIFSTEELDILENGYNPYYPPVFLDYKNINNEIPRYYDDSRMF